MPSKGTTIRSVRVPEDVWSAALERAASEGTTVSAVIVDALREYVADSAAS